MKHSEKKYRLDSLSAMVQLLKSLNAEKTQTSITIHYHAHLESKDVIRLVEYSDKSEIHKLKESRGTFSLTERIPMNSKAEGLKWLMSNGFSVVDVLKMENTDYAYKNGIAGLYIIDDFLYSVILDYPDVSLENIQKLFNLNTTEVITVPYNKYLNRINRLRTKKISDIK